MTAHAANEDSTAGEAGPADAIGTTVQTIDSTERDSRSRRVSMAHGDRIASHAKILKRGRDEGLSDMGHYPTLDLESESDGESESSLDGEGYSKILSAATGRQDFLTWQQARTESKRARLRTQNVVDGNGEEGAFRAPTAGLVDQKEILAKMINALEGTRSDMGGLKKKLERITSDEKRPLDTPLPAPVANRVERSVAYEKSTEEISKWNAVVKKHRKAEHLAFPLNEPGGKISRTSRDAAVGMNPSSKFECEVDELLKEAGVATDAEIFAREEIELEKVANNISREEVVARRRELARLRSVMFLHDKKLKRIKKIKSRKFRRMMKLERARASEEASAELDSNEDNSKELAIKAERERAEERMTLRHKNTSKWIRRQLRRGEAKKNPNAREAIEEQLRLHDELRKKQQNSTVGNSRAGTGGNSDGNTSDDSDGNDADELQRIQNELEHAGNQPRKGLMGLKFMQDAQERRKQEALRLLEEMDETEDNADDESNCLSDRGTESQGITKDSVSIVGRGNTGDKVGRRVFSAAKNDMPAHRAEPCESASLHEVSNDIGDSHIFLSSENGADAAQSAEEVGNDEELTYKYANGDSNESICHNIDRNDARLSNVLFKVDKQLSGTESETVGHLTTLSGRISASTGAVDNQNSTRDSVGKRSGRADNRSPGGSMGMKKYSGSSRTAVKCSVAENPWLRPVTSSARNASAELVVSDDNQLVPASTTRKGKDVSAGNRNINDPNSSFASVAQHNVRSPSMSGSFENCRTPSCKSQEGNRIKSDGGTSTVMGKKMAKDLERMRVVAEAFADAGGADLADFEASKAAELEQSLPTAKDIGATVLPGWGSWSGSDARKSEDKSERESAFAKAAREKLEAARKQAVSARPDSALPHVIINAKRAKKAADLTMAAVPFPFTSPEQWEREVGVPLLRERMTHASHSAAIRSRLTVPRGEAVQPLRMSVAATKDLGVKRLAIERRSKRAKVRESNRRPLLS